MGIARDKLADAHEARGRPGQIQTQVMAKTRVEDTIEPPDPDRRLLLPDELSQLDDAPARVIRMACYDDLTHTQFPTVWAWRSLREVRPRAFAAAAGGDYGARDRSRHRRRKAHPGRLVLDP